MRLFTSFWSNPELRNLDAVPVSISRGEPRWRLGFAYRRLRTLAPNDETWAQEDRDSYAESYRAQLEALGVERIMADLERIAGNYASVLLCWEQPGDEWCHRWLLRDFLHEQAGITIPELRAGDLPRRPDSPQPSLFDERGGA